MPGKHDISPNAVLRYVQDYVAAEGVSPTYREIARAVGCSISTVKLKLDLLAMQGRLRYRAGSPRSIVLSTEFQRHCETCRC